MIKIKRLNIKFVFLNNIRIFTTYEYFNPFKFYTEFY